MPARRSLAVLLALALILLSACGGGAARPTPEPLQLSAGAQTARPVAEQVIEGEEIPGRLLFVQKGTIWLWQGRTARVLLGDGAAWQPAWSPDGNRIAYIQRGVSYSDVMLADASGQLLAQLTSNGSNKPPTSAERIYETTWAFYPSWSPDGTRIIVASQYGPPIGSPAQEYNLALFALPANGGAWQQLYADETAQCGRAIFAPSGTSLVYTRTATEQNGQQQLYGLDLRSNASVPFPGAPPQSYDPALSADGMWLAFALRDGDRTDIAVLPTASGTAPTLQRLTGLGTARAPAFSPDGKKLAFLAIPEGKTGFELWVADLSVDASGVIRSSTPRRITTDLGLDADSGLSWGP